MVKCAYCENEAENKCDSCHNNICESHKVEIGTFVLCRNCLKRKLVIISVILLFIIAFVIIAINFWPR